MPVNAAATGKAIMAFQSRELIAEALSHELPKPTVNSRTSRKWIEQEYRLLNPPLFRLQAPIE